MAECAHCEHMECSKSGMVCYEIDTDGIFKGNDLEIMQKAAEVESEGYIKIPRLEEIILFADKMGFKKLGMAFCSGFIYEAGLIADILEKKFELHSVMCKNCGISKNEYNLKKVRDIEDEAACNPIGQAKVLEQCGTQMNIAVGLCVGHDMLFNKYSHTLTTTFIVKDRLLAHNPIGVIYSKYLRNKLIDKLS